jgi:cytolysin-activating lysine-acyltransferase
MTDEQAGQPGGSEAKASRQHPGTAMAPPDAVFGQVVWLLMNIPVYRHLFLTDLEWMVLPPIMLSQYRLFRDGNRVVAFAAWANLSEAAEARLQEPNARLAPADWRSGDRLWLVNLFAPFGHQEAALKELEQTALAGKTFRMHRHGPDGKRSVEVVGATI